jgi:Protein of unknown function (DUF3293)
MTIDPATLAAYRQTEYRVFGAMPAVLRVGVRCPELALLHAAHDTQCSAFITACNPLGARLADAVNQQRQEALAAQLSRQGLVAIAGIGQHPVNSWPGEPSYLVPAVTRTAAQQLGQQFEQNAIIWAGADAVPELILLR